MKAAVKAAAKPVARAATRREKALWWGLFVLVTVPFLNNLETLQRFMTTISNADADAVVALFEQAVPLLSSPPLRASTRTSSTSSSPHLLLWPQKDDRIRKTIQNGIRIDVNQTGEYHDTNKREYYGWNGTRYEAPPPQLSTVVTAYYDMPSKHPTHSYQQWFHWMLKATDPMVIFIDPNTEWLEFVKERRKHAPTIIAPLAFANLTMATTFSDDFWKKKVFPSDKGKRFKKGIDVYKIWNEKMVFMHEVAELNPFQTEQFLWIDAGYYRSKASAPIAQPIVRNNLTQNGLEPDKVALQHVGASTSRYELAGGAWGGTRAAIANMYERYFETFWWMVTQRIGCVGYEQRIFVVMCKSFPSLCSIHRIPDWFGMGGRSWLRNPMQSFANPEQDMPGFRFHRVVQSPVIFPSADVIHSVDAF